MTRFPVDKTWFKTRLKQKGMSQRKVSALLGFDHSTISRVLRGEQPLRVDQAVALSRYFEVSLYELLRRAGAAPPEEGNTLPVIGGLNAVFEVTPRELPPVSSLPVFEQAAVCLLCDDTNSMFYGWIFAYVPTTDLAPIAIGRLSVVQLSTGRKLLGFLTPGPSVGRFNVRLLTGRDRIDLEVKAAAPVLHIRPAQPS